MSDDWRKLIAIAHLVRARLAELDEEEMWPHYLPQVAASEYEIIDVELRLGEALPPEYREFLSCANGWQCFYQAVDLFGLSDLVSGLRRDRALSILATVEPLWPVCGVHSADVWPIAVSRNDIDLFLLVKPSSPSAGQVFWIAGSLVEKFINFREFFLAMIDYNREDIKHLSMGDSK